MRHANISVSPLRRISPYVTLIRIVDHTPVVKPGQKNSHNSLVNLGRIMNRRSWLSWLVSQIRKHKLYYYYFLFSRLPIEKLLMLNRQGMCFCIKEALMKKKLLIHCYLGESMFPCPSSEYYNSTKKELCQDLFSNSGFSQGQQILVGWS